ncbi:Ig-like domain-containing protein [Massilia agilis]|uniref:Ig-like domain-containing protein n=1 Tax=Massilia agilis TaxID=1811226 RepID=A0ABT2DEB6_9BURK|nr:Ig-like domain-containing protein [Massilia agilis]MCS0809576.1 Ig-like domain-containing protein [Massilia agilis]
MNRNPIDAGTGAPNAAAEDDATPASQTTSNPVRKEVVFIDTSVAGFLSLEAAVRPGVEVVRIDGGQGGLAQLASWAQTHSGYDAIHILSHGSGATLHLGTDEVTAASLALPSVRDQFATLGRALNAGGDLLLYGCDIGAGTAGQQLAADIAAAAHADVAVSTDITGAASKGGNWNLEYSAGQIDSASIIDASHQDAYAGVLTRASLLTTFSDITTATTYGTLSVGVNGTVTATDIDASGWNLVAASSGSTIPVTVKGVTTGTQQFVRVQGNNITYIDWKLNDSTYTFDLQSFDLAPTPGACVFTIQAIDASNNVVPGSAFIVAANGTSSAAPTFTQALVPAYLTLLYNDIHGFRITLQDNASYSPLFDNIQINDLKQSNSPPINTVAPSLSGSAKLGNVLTASTGTWSDPDGDPLNYSYQWFRALDSSGTSATLITGAASSTYALGDADAHKYLAVQITANDGTGNSTVAVSGWTAVADTAPVNSVQPYVTGTSQIGSTITGNIGTWSDIDHDSILYTFQWFRADDSSGTGSAAITGARMYTYTPGSADAHKYLSLRVTADDNHGGTSVASTAWTVVGNSAPANSVAPSLSGDTLVGATLTGTNGTWTDADGDSLTGYAYQWYRANDSSGTGATAISGATSASYVLDAGDAHKYVRLQVTASDGYGGSTPGYSGWTAVTDTPPVCTARPTITGTVAVGSAAGAASGSWTDIDGDSLTYNYQWFRADDSNGTNAALITGANTATYTPALSDKDKYLSVYVVANDGYGSLTQTRSAWSQVLEIPTITNVTSSDADVAYKAGSTLTISVTMSNAVTVDTSGGTPTLALASGGAATYSGGSGTSTLTFSYVVGNGENSADLDYSSMAALSLNGATIKSTAVGNLDANTTLPVPGTAGSLGANKAIVIDTTPPAATVTSVAFSGDTGASPTDLVTKIASQTLMGTLSAPLGTGETVLVSLDNGSTWTAASASAGTTTFMLSGQTLAGSGTLKAKLADAIGNEGSVYSASYVIDTVAPAITVGAIALSSDTGNSSTDFITKTASQTITASLSAALAGTDTLYGSVDGGATWTNITAKVSGTALTWNGVTLANGTNAIKFKVTDLAGNDGTVATQSYTVDASAPTTTIASAFLSDDTGSSPTDFVTNDDWQTISGTLSANIGAGETVWVSLDGGSTWSAASASGNAWSQLAGVFLAGSGTLKVKVSDAAGNDGPVYTQAYVLDTVAPAITFSNLQLSGDTGRSGTDFVTNVAAQTITATLSQALAAGDTVYGSLNGGATWTNITAKISGTTLTWNGVTLASSGTLKLRAVDSAGNIGTVTSQAYVLDTTAPALTFGNVHISADTGVISTDFITNTASQTITGTLSGSLAPGDTVYGSTDGGATWTDVTAKVSGTTLTWDGATLTGSSIALKVVDAAGNDGAVSAQSYVLDTAAPANTGASVSFSSDTGTSATDLVTRTAPQDISGTLTAALASGEAVYVSLDDGATWTMANASVGQATWSLPGQTLAGSSTIKVKVSDTAGNDGAIYSHTYVLDAAAPATTIANIALSADSGTSSSDFVTNTASQTISATLSGALGAGEALYGSLDGGATWTDITAKVSGTTIAWDGVTLAGSNTIKFKVSDQAGNDGAVASQAYTLDTIAPALTFSDVHISADTGAMSTDFVTNTASQTITATLSGGLAAGDIVYGSTDGGATWTDITAKVSGTTLTWDGATLTGSSIKLKVVDAAGNDGAVSAQSYVLDTTAPAKTGASVSFSGDTGVSATDLVTHTTAQDITGTLTAPLASGEAVYVSLDDGATWTMANASVGQATWSLPGQTLAGSSTIKVKVGDTAGNDGAVYSHTYVLDTTAPATTIANIALSADSGTSSSDFVTNTASQTISATLSGALGAGEALYGSLDGGATWTDITAKVTGTTIAWDGVTLAGSNTIKFKVSDLAGNDGAVASQAYTLDTTAPALTFGNVHISADTGVMSTDFITNTASQTITATLSGGLAAGDIVYGSTDGGATWTDITAKVSGTTLTWDGATLTGSSIKLKVVDAAGNDGAVSAQSYVLDTTAPAKTGASVSFSGDTGVSATDLVTHTTAQDITGTLTAALASGEAVYVSLDDGATWTMANASVGQATWSLPGQTLAGSSTIKVKVSDTAGNDGAIYSHTYVLDTVAPTTTVANIALSADSGTSSSDFVTKTASQTISATLSGALGAGEALYGSLDGGATWTDITAKVTGTAITWDGVTLAGSNTIKFKVSDLAGNDGAVASQAYTLDTTAPALTFSDVHISADTGAMSTDFITNTASQTITATLSGGLAAGDIVYGSTDGGATWTDVTAKVSGTTLTWDGATLTGSSIKLKVVDAAGNDGAVSAQSYVLDITAPTATIANIVLSADTGSSATDFFTNTASQTISATLSGALGAGEALYGSLDGGATWTDITAKVTGTTIAWDGVTLSGNNTIKFKVSDLAGNDGAVASQAYTLDTTAPALTFSDVHISADTGAMSTDFITNTASQTITATLSGGLALGDIVYGSTDGGATWTNVTSKVSGTTLTWDGATLTGSSIKLKVVDAAGNDGAVAAQSYVLDTTAPAKTGASVSFSGDTGTSATDLVTHTTAQDITGTLTAVLASGEAVYVSLDDGATWATANASVGQATWSLPGQTVSGSSTIKVKVGDTAGNDGAIYSHTYVLDTTAPATTVANIALSADSGASSSDFVTKTASQTISATLSGVLGAGDALYGSLDGGATWTDITAKVTGTTIAWDGVTLAGSSTIKFKVSDLAGNDGAAASQAYTVDTTAPVLSFSGLHLSVDTGSSGADFITNAASQTISATLSAALALGDIVYGSLDGGATWTDITAKVSGTTLAWDGALLAGSSTIKLKVSDAAGNDGPAYSQAYVLDTLAPAATATVAAFSNDTGASGTDFVTKSAAQTISGTLSASIAAGDTVYVSLDAGASWTAASASGSTWSLAGQTLTASGTLKVKITDIAGNDSVVYSHAYTLDTAASSVTFSNLALSTDSGVSASDFVTNTTTQTISATLSAPLEAGDAVYGSLDGGATWTDITAKVTGTTLAWDGALLAGASSIKLKVTDTAGNDGAVSTQAYVLDTSAPGVTVSSVAFSNDTGASGTDLVTSAAAQVISGNLSANLAAGDTVYVSLDNGSTWAAATATAGQSTWTLAGQVLSGSGTVKVKVSDAAGNDGAVVSRAYVLDAAAPAVEIGGLAPSSDTGASSTDKLTNLATPTFNGTAEAGALVKLFDTDGTTLLGSATADGAGNWTITASAMAGGSHDVSATATDTAGNTGAAPARLHIDIDLTAPAAQAAPVLLAASDSGAVGDGLTNVATPTVAGHGEAFSQVSLYDTDGATLLGSVQADATGAWQITASALAEGSHNLSVKETDAAGNVSAASAPLNLAIDTTAPAAPAAPALTAASDSDTRGDGVTEYVPAFEGSALANAKVELYDGAARIGVATADASGKWTIAPANMLLGTHSLTARQYDAAGNLSGASATFTLHVVERSVQTNLVDGVQVATTQVTLPGGQAGTAVVIPIVTPTRVESTGSPGVADIPLASNAGGSVLTAQVAPGYGLTATGTPSQPAANASATLIAAIKAATPDHPIDDQGHLTGNGQSFLDKLPAAQPLLVETVVPVVSGPTAPTGSLSLSGSTGPDQHVALVIDTSRLPSGSTIGLQNVDFAAVIGGANVVSDGRSQLLSGDAASQHFTVATGGSGAIYAGGGNDGFTWGLPPAQNGANVRADVAPVATQTLLHGGAGSDTITFNGNRDSFNIEFHNGYQVVSTKAQPSVKALVVNVETLQFGDSAVAVPTGDDLTTIAGLYQGIYGRQADLYGFEFWADAHQKYGMSWGKMAMMMITQGEWNAHHEALNGSSSHDVEVLYEALFSRKADAAGLDFWVGVMKQHGLSLEQVADFMVQAPEMNGHREMVTNWDFLV